MVLVSCMFFFFFKQKTAYEMRISDWSSDVCSSDLQAHFLRSVLRLGPGARLAVFNGRDGEWLAEIDALGKGWCSLALIEQRRAAAPEPDLWLVFARSEERRVGKECVSTCRSRWSPDH